MKKIAISLPMPIVRPLTPKLQELATDTQLEFRGLHQEEDDPLPLKGDDIPELIATHQISIMKNRDAMISSGSYEALEGVLPEMRDDLKERGFIDPSGYFIPMCFVPIVLIYNRFIEPPPSTWMDLLEKQWEGGIGAAIPGMVRRLLKANLKSLFGEKVDPLGDNMDFNGLPVDVNLAVDDGTLDVGILPLPFARSSRKENVSMCWPEEGAFCVPHVLIYKKGAHKDAIKIGRYLLSNKVQQFVSRSGLIPVNPNVLLPEEAIENKLNFYWKGWDWFIERLNSV
jgi:ABC-type Fe3+ transport system substrate-binding protein